MSDILLTRINELERQLHNARQRLYEARRSRDRWKAKALALAPDARRQRRWQAHITRLTRTP